MSNEQLHTTPFEHAYITGLLTLEHKSLREMGRKGLLPCHPHHAAYRLASDPHPHQASLARRLQQAPQGWALAVDEVVVPKEGPLIQGLSRIWATSEKRVVWGLRFLSLSLVAGSHDPYPLGLWPLPPAPMATPDYPYRTPTQASLQALQRVLQTGYCPKVLLGDARMLKASTHPGLLLMGIGAVHRVRKDLKVSYRGQWLRADELAAQYKPGTGARYYRGFGLYAKRLRVERAEAGEVDLLMVWRGKDTGWELLVLLSSLQEAGVQEVLAYWKARWRQEVGHKGLKALGLGQCQARSYASQLKHADLTVEGYLLLWAERQREPTLSWREARERVGGRLKERLVTELCATSPGSKQVGRAG